MTPACSTKGCKNPSVHRVDWQASEGTAGSGHRSNITVLARVPKHYCPACFQRKVWGK